MFYKSPFILCCIIAALLVSSCNDTGGSEQDPNQLLIGKWQNVSLVMTTNSVNNLDSTSVMKVDESNWEEELNIKPIITEFRADSTYTSTYRNLNDSIVGTTKGKWYVKGDSITMIEYGNPNSYYMELAGDTASFTGYLDWDGDGKSDDYYVGVQKRIR